MRSQNVNIKDAVIQNIRKDMAQFDIGERELKERISVRLDTDQFNAKEDKGVWLQKRGDSPFVCEVYFDEVWMCDLHENDSHTKLKLKYFKGFLKAYESKKIMLNRELAKQIAEAEEIAKKQADQELDEKIKKLPSKTIEDQVAKEIIKEIKEERDTNAQST